MNPERRQSPRQHIHSLVYVDLQPGNGGIVLDVSEGGMQISVANRLVGTEDVRFSFCLQARERIEGTGRIAWISPSGKNAGVRFVSLPQAARAQIRSRVGISPAAEASPDLPGTAISTPASAPPGEQPASAPPSENVANPSAHSVAKEVSDRNAAHLSESAKGSASPPGKPSQPPQWYEELVRTAKRERDKDMFPGTEQPEEQTKTGPLDPEQVGWPATGALFDGQPVERRPFADPSSALYLPNYLAIEDRKTGDVRLSKFDLRDSSQVAVKLAFERLEEFGWTLESDWHIWVAIVLLLGGFVALMLNPPLVMLAGALWVVSAVIALKRKERPRPADKNEPDRQ